MIGPGRAQRRLDSGFWVLERRFDLRYYIAGLLNSETQPTGNQKIWALSKVYLDLISLGDFRRFVMNP